jgi:hypothetical protein
MKHAIIYDCEFLTNKTAMSHGWCAPHDPDPTVVQIGAVKISLTDGLPIEDTKTIYITPKDRYGNNAPLDPFFTELTGITQQDIDDYGVSLEQGFKNLNDFSDGATLWAWGHDERYLMAISAYVHNVPPSIPATRFDNAKKIMTKAGMPHEDLFSVNSGKLASYYKLPQAKNISEHDGLNDALSITYAMQHLQAQGKLNPEWLATYLKMEIGDY